MKKLLDSLDEGTSLYLTTKDKAVVKITKITIEDDHDDAFYEVLCTNPNKSHLNLEQLSFINQRVFETDELFDHLTKEYFIQY